MMYQRSEWLDLYRYARLVTGARSLPLSDLQTLIVDPAKLYTERRPICKYFLWHRRRYFNRCQDFALFGICIPRASRRIVLKCHHQLRGISLPLLWQLSAILPLTAPSMRLLDRPTLGPCTTSYSTTTSAMKMQDGTEQLILVVGRVKQRSSSDPSSASLVSIHVLR